MAKTSKAVKPAKEKKTFSIRNLKEQYHSFKTDTQFANDRKRWSSNVKGFIIGLLKFLLIVGVSYVILGPVLGIISKSFFSNADNYNPMVYMIPQEPTLERYTKAIAHLDYWKVVCNSLIYTVSLMLIQVFICSMVGYGFARYKFPLKGLLFGCVVVMIVIPTHTIMLPLYMTFANFDVLGIIKLIRGAPVNILSTPIPLYIMTAFGCGLRSGLYIIFLTSSSAGCQRRSRRRRSWTVREPGIRISASC